MSKYLEILIGNEPVEVTSIEELPLTISYRLEDKEDFTKKKGSVALSVVLPATVQNDKVANTYHNPSIEDLTANQSYRGIRDSIIRVSGQELMVGKAFLKSAKHNRIPIEYAYDFYGNNADWMIDLKESTLHEFLKHITFTFNKSLIIDSWDFDGTDEALPYVFAPIKYGQIMSTLPSLIDGKVLEDYNMEPTYMKPSISKYWLIYWAFKSIGYRVQSDFFETEYFRRQVMPWTWGNFLDSDGTRLDVLKFLALSTNQVAVVNEDFEGWFDVMATNDSTNGGYDNSGTYTYEGGEEMRWTYPTVDTLDFGILEATLHLNIFAEALAVASSDVTLEIAWFKNGVQDGASTMLVELHAPVVGRRDANGSYEDYHTFTVSPGDYLSARVWLHVNSTSVGRAHINFSVDTFEMAYFRTPLGGTIDFDNFLGLKKYKFLEFLAGVVDEFNLTIQTNSAEKVVYMEPTHPYATGHDLSLASGGYFNGKYLDWSDKQDLAQDSEIENFVDSERELVFKYKDDSNDGTLKKIQDRNTTKLGLGKYVFPERFKAGKKEIENRFFSPTMHYDVEQWRTVTHEPPQMIIMAPENVSNLSRGEAQNTFQPKSVYYKGTTTDYKWVFDGEDTHPYPFMFAVNYKTGGEVDPILSYSDELIGPELTPITGKGLLRRFFLQRLAIMRNGQYYTTWFRLNNNDVANFLHREHIICRGQRWELIELNYKPLKDESTQCTLKKWAPILSA